MPANEPLVLSPFFVEFILPFVLVFTLLFAILEKTKLLGEGKRQVNLIMSIVIGLIMVASPFNIIVVQLMPFLAVSLVILFVFMLGYGFIVGKTDGDVLNKGLKIALSIIFGLALLTFLLYISGYWDYITGFLYGGGSGQVWINILLIAIIIAAIAAVLWGDKSS